MLFKIITFSIVFTQFSTEGFSLVDYRTFSLENVKGVVHRRNVLFSTLSPPSDEKEQKSALLDDKEECEREKIGAISMNVDQLAIELEGRGRARLVWDYYRIGVDPLVYFRHGDHNTCTNSGNNEPSMSITTASPDTLQNFLKHMEGSEEGDDEKEKIRNLLPTCRKTQGLGVNALKKLEALYEHGGLEGRTATLSFVSTSSDGTTKLLIKLADGLEVETVIIPWHDKGWSTVCISSQVGCRQGCTFCATGRMGKLRSLTSDEILAQFYFALKICRLSSSNIPPLSNVVFMGMGEPADNAEAVCRATEILTDVDLFHMGQSKVTVSTVAPSPNAFASFKDAPCVLAWSVHAANDELRKKLVPTTKYTMHELRKGLIDTLLYKPKRLRAIMLEVALIKDINVHPEAAEELAEFAKVIIDSVPGAKLVVNLIPFNDIGHPTYRKPSDEDVKVFQNILWERSIFTHIRTTRGDDESAACGQLATKKEKVR
mmetsp:Transcript_460/g.714  ORF Transcript_460/g.714 Transcript_460/m.714 type:complete len:487 (-) Transcript_460:2755-4215(-)